MKQSRFLYLIALMLFLGAVANTFNAISKENKLMSLCQRDLTTSRVLSICDEKSCVNNLSPEQAKSLAATYPDYSLKYCTSDSLHYGNSTTALLNVFMEQLFKNIIVELIGVLFILSINKTIRFMPQGTRIKNVWLLALTIMPMDMEIMSMLGMVISVIEFAMLAVVIPNALKKSMPDNPALLKESQTLFNLGGLIFTTSVLTISRIHNQVSSSVDWQLLLVVLAGLVVLLMYWVKIVKIRKFFDKVNADNNFKLLPKTGCA